MPNEMRRLDFGGVAFATATVAAAALAAFALERFLPVASLALLFVCAVLVVAVRTRTSTALFAAVASALAYNFLFTEPRLTLRMSSPSDVVAVIAFLITALLVGQLAGRQHVQVLQLRVANENARTLQSLGERLAAASDETQVYGAGCDALATALGRDCIALTWAGAESGALLRAASWPDSVELEANDLAAARWVAAHAQQAVRHASRLGGSPWWFLPMVVNDACLGTIGLRLPAAETELAAEPRLLAQAIVQQTAQAAERTRLVARLEDARIEGESERLRSALLSSVSHDLRSPLASVIGAASSLAAYGDNLPEADRRELLGSIRSEGERLDRYIQNLLDMTRLGAGAMKLQRDWVGLDEIVGSARGRLAKLFPSTTVVTDLDAAGTPPPPLFVHAALVEQALFNVLENAAKFSPPEAPIVVRARRAGDRLQLDVVDSGPGIPEEERRKIFDLFYSGARGAGGGSGDRAARGSGLGLTIVRGMIGAHGGKVEALPGDGGAGTTIRMMLPLPDAPAEAEADATSLEET